MRAEIVSDVTLRQSLEQEGSKFEQFLTNKFKIVALTSIDVFNGKQKQKLLEPPIVEEEIIPDDTREDNQTNLLDPGVGCVEQGEEETSSEVEDNQI